MTVEALAALLCAASSMYARPQPTPDDCLERAAKISQAAERHGVHPVLMVAVDMQECDLREHADVPLYASKRRKKVVGYDACPMGLRVMDAGAADLTSEEVYELAAARMAKWRGECEKRRDRDPTRCAVRRWNPGNPVYASQVMSYYAVLRGWSPKYEDVQKMSKRTLGNCMLLRKALRRAAARRKS